MTSPLAPGPALPLYATLLLSVCLTTIFINSFLLFVLVRRKQTAVYTNLALVSLALADLLLVLVAVPLEIVSLINPDLFNKDSGLLFIDQFAEGVGMTVKTWSIAFVAASNYRCVRKNEQHQSLTVLKTMQMSILVVWMLSVLYGLRELFMVTRSLAASPDGEIRTRNDSNTSALSLPDVDLDFELSKRIIILDITLESILPSAVVCTCNILLVTSSAHLVDVRVLSETQIMARRCVRVTLALMLFFVFTRLPYQIMRACILWYGGANLVVLLSEQILRVTMFTNCSFNVFLYLIYARNPKLQPEVCHCLTRTNEVHPVMSMRSLQYEY